MFKLIPSVTSLIILLVLAACQTPAPVVPTVPSKPIPSSAPGLSVNKKAGFKQLEFAALPGWGQDNLTELWPAFQASCSAQHHKPDWREICAVAQQVDVTSNSAIREFFEAFFLPFQISNPDDTDTGLITGYYEPLLHGARQRGGRYQIALYAPPPDLLTIDLAGLYPELKGMRLRGRVIGSKVEPYPSRAELLQGNALAGQEICWVDDSVDAFFLQVQGSGRVILKETGETIRVAYADQNGQPYKSIGRYLVDQGELRLDQASAQGIKNWISAHPARENEVLNANPSFVFFKEEKLVDPQRGPKGAQGVPLTEQRSLAIDAQFLPLGAPIYISTTQPNSNQPIQRLMMAQDTGGAIRGAVRADFYWGFGAQAGEMAGRMKQRGMLWLLWPKLAPLPPGGPMN